MNPLLHYINIFLNKNNSKKESILYTSVSLIFLWVLSWILIVIKRPQKLGYSLFRIYMDINQYYHPGLTSFPNEIIENISQQDIKYFLNFLYKFHIRYTNSIKYVEGCKNVYFSLRSTLLKVGCKWNVMKDRIYYFTTCHVTLKIP